MNIDRIDYVITDLNKYKSEESCNLKLFILKLAIFNLSRELIELEQEIENVF
jgi:hypothetical protein